MRDARRALAVGAVDAGAGGAEQWRESSSTIRQSPFERASSGGPRLPAGAEVIGPAVIEEPNSTTFIHPGDLATVSESGHLIITLERMTTQ